MLGLFPVLTATGVPNGLAFTFHWRALVGSRVLDRLLMGGICWGLGTPWWKPVHATGKK